MRVQRWARALVVTVSAAGAPVAMAQMADQAVTFSVVPVSRVSLSGSVAPIVVSIASAGQAPTSASTGGSTYAVTTNETNQKITASLSQAMPAGVSLAVSLAAPAGAASTGTSPLGTAETDVVTGISAVSATALPIIYTLNASSAAHVTSGTRVVTYTITSGP